MVRSCSSLEMPASVRPGLPPSWERARGAGLDVLLGRSIDLVGTELPYQPLVEALRPLGDRSRCPAGGFAVEGVRGDARPAHRASRVHAGAARARGSARADSSTLDLVVFLAHNLDDRRVLLLATYRADEPASTDPSTASSKASRRRIAARGRAPGHSTPRRWRRWWSPTPTPLPPALAGAIIARSEGNPFSPKSCSPPPATA